jgi:TPP-dependent indolepyruvate ferredoxin oxidoreductase alpha subunit
MHDGKQILIVDDAGSTRQLETLSPSELREAVEAVANGNERVVVIDSIDPAVEARRALSKAVLEVEKPRFVEKRHRPAIPQGTEKEPPPALMGVTKLTETAAATRKSKVVARSKAMANQAKKLVDAGNVKGAEKIKRRLEKLARGLV